MAGDASRAVEHGPGMRPILENGTLARSSCSSLRPTDAVCPRGADRTEGGPEDLALALRERSKHLTRREVAAHRGRVGRPRNVGPQNECRSRLEP